MRSLTILLAEDEPVIALEIQHLLEGKGYRVIKATATEDVIAACERYHPDLVILNVKQQGNNYGMELARMLQSHFMLQVAFITGARPQDISTSSHFVSSPNILYKPFTRTQLQQCVQRWLA